MPEVLIVSALGDAERRGIGAICIFLSYSGEPELIRRLLDDPRVASVGTKDSPYESLLPEDLKDNARLGRYWEPGGWTLPARSSHVYFVGPWRLVTADMLREAARGNVRTLRVRVSTFWASVPLVILRLATRSPSILRELRAVVQKAIVVRKTLFIRHLDNTPEVLIASALADAERRGVGAICMFLSYSGEPELIRRLLDDPRVASVGTKDSPYESLLPEDLKDNARLGRYWEPGGWTLPARSSHVYFVGPWRLVTADMLREAVRRDLPSLRVRITDRWASVPLNSIYTFYVRLRPLLAYSRSISSRWQSMRWDGRRSAARSLLFLRPDAVELACRVAGPAGLQGIPLPSAFAHIIQGAAPRTDAVLRRIVHVCGNLQPGGAERQVAYTLQGLSRQDIESVQLLCHHLTRDGERRYDFYLPAVEECGIRAREIRRRATATNPSSMPAQLTGIARILPTGLVTDIANLYWEFSELRPQIVHTWLDWDNVRAGLAAVLAGVPRVIVSGRNVNPSHFGLYQPYMDPAYRALARVPTVTLINNSRAGADDYADWIGIPRNKIGVVHNAVDFRGRTRLDEDTVKARRAAIGLPPGSFVVGGVFRLEEEKRPLLWVDTAACVAKQVPDAWFVVFGQGNLLEQMQRRAKNVGLGERLIMAGVTSDIVSAMSIMDVLLLTSFGEGLPNVLLEAQWVGTPVVTTDVGGAKEAICTGITGWAVGSDQPDDLAQPIMWLHGHPLARTNALDHGPLFVRGAFGMERMVSDLMRVYGLR